MIMRFIYFILSYVLCTTLWTDEAISSSSELNQQQTESTNWFAQLFGVGMWPLWILSIILIMLVLERKKSLQRELIIDSQAIDSCIDALSQNNIDQADTAVSASQSILCQAWSQGLKVFKRGREPLAGALTTTSTLALKPLKRNVTAITTIGVIAPLLGLLGTVIGMIITFAQIEATGGADKSALAGGISVALFTTAGGLVIAIPAIVSSRFFNNMLVNYAEEIELAINRADYCFEEAQHKSDEDNQTEEDAS